MKGRSHATRLGGLAKSEISTSLLSYAKRMPKEILRKPRTLFEYERWKANELRTFVIYTGPVALLGNVDDAIYKNFLMLSVATSLLANPLLYKDYCSYVHDLLVTFVQHVSQLYGADQIVYTMHSVIHLPDDARIHGPLDKFSAFPFESFLGQLKSLVKKRSHELQQVILRIGEKSKLQRKKKTDEKIILKKEHVHGPLPENADLRDSRQYGEAILDNMTLAVMEGDNCVRIRGKVVIIMNILRDSAGQIFIVYCKYRSQGAFYDYPMESTHIDIHQVETLGNRLHVADIQEVEGKYVLLPLTGNKEVAIHLLHTGKCL